MPLCGAVLRGPPEGAQRAAGRAGRAHLGGPVEGRPVPGGGRDCPREHVGVERCVAGRPEHHLLHLEGGDRRAHQNDGRRARAAPRATSYTSTTTLPLTSNTSTLPLTFHCSDPCERGAPGLRGNDAVHQLVHGQAAAESHARPLSAAALSGCAYSVTPAVTFALTRKWPRKLGYTMRDTMGMNHFVHYFESVNVWHTVQYCIIIVSKKFMHTYFP